MGLVISETGISTTAVIRINIDEKGIRETTNDDRASNDVQTRWLTIDRNLTRTAR